ncbi:hypothetical protein GCM10029978_051520 [Actinoallomurus acanthiterrae]
MQTRHRALVRLEDVNPTIDPADIRAITDYLSGQHVPFAPASSRSSATPMARATTTRVV